MMAFSLDTLVRENIRTMEKYASARDEFSGTAAIFLDANENSAGSATRKKMNRYPDPLQQRLRKKIAVNKAVDPVDKVFLGNGSDEAIDLLVRAFCEPGRDSLMIMPPTYGMYRVCAAVNDVNVLQVPLRDDFSLDTEKIISQASKHRPKLIFICSPNNPSGNLFDTKDIEKILSGTESLVLVDEAYIDFSDAVSWNQRIDAFPNLVVIQTFSKAWGMAGLRLGMAFAAPGIIEIMNKIKYPYNVSDLTAEAALKALKDGSRKQRIVRKVKKERAWLTERLRELPAVEKVFPTDANFFLLRVNNAKAVYRYLRSEGIVVRDRSGQMHCGNCLRITVGTRRENRILLKKLNAYSGERNP